MAFDEGLAERIRFLTEDRLEEKRMFGGLCFLDRGHMVCGIVGKELMVRVGAPQHATALAEPHAREMTFTGRAMKGLVFVGIDGFGEDEDLEAWVRRGLDHARSLPHKGAATTPKRKTKAGTVTKKSGPRKKPAT